MFTYPQPRAQPDEEESELSDEERQLWQWRFETALAAKLRDPDARLFADHGIDSHALTDLTGAGCDPALALRILLQ